MWEEDLESASRRKVAWLIGIVGAAAVAFVGWYWYGSRHRPAGAERQRPGGARFARRCARPPSRRAVPGAAEHRAPPRRYRRQPAAQEGGRGAAACETDGGTDRHRHAG